MKVGKWCLMCMITNNQHMDAYCIITCGKETLNMADNDGNNDDGKPVQPDVTPPEPAEPVSA